MKLKLGLSVVKGYGPVFNLTEEIFERMVDLPALGNPTNPTSAINLSSSSSSFTSPGFPGVHLDGARLVDDLKAVFPFPPFH